MTGKHPQPMLVVSMLGAILFPVLVGGQALASWDYLFNRDDSFFPAVNLQSSGPPITTDPPDQRVLLNQPGVTVQWTILDDDTTSGLYVMLVDQALEEDALAATLISQTLHTWYNNTPITINVSTIIPGNHNFTIFFTDMTLSQIFAALDQPETMTGNMSTAWVYIERPPVIDFIGRTRFHVGEAGQSMDIRITDLDTLAGTINVTVNGTHVFGPNDTWTHPDSFIVPINTTAPATFDFHVAVWDHNYTITAERQVQVAHSVPPEIHGLDNQTISVDVGFAECIMVITDMENATGNYTILRNGNQFNASHVNATWTNNTGIPLHLETIGAGYTTFEVIAQDLDGTRATITFWVFANTPPVISTPANITISSDTRNQNITWTITDVDNRNGTCTVWRNNSAYLYTFQNRQWMNGTSINVPIIVDATGIYMFTIHAFDGYSTRFQTTRITVTAARDDLLSEETKNIILIIFIIAGIAGFGIIAYRKKN